MQSKKTTIILSVLLCVFLIYGGIVSVLEFKTSTNNSDNIDALSNGDSAIFKIKNSSLANLEEDIREVDVNGKTEKFSLSVIDDAKTLGLEGEHIVSQSVVLNSKRYITHLFYSAQIKCDEKDFIATVDNMVQKLAKTYNKASEITYSYLDDTGKKNSFSDIRKIPETGSIDVEFSYKNTPEKNATISFLYEDGTIYLISTFYYTTIYPIA